MNDAAARLGLIAGMALADARAMYPASGRRRCRSGSRRAPCSKPSPTGATAIRRWSGSIAPDGILLDITGCAHLFGGEAALCRDLVERLAWQGLQAQRRGGRHGRLRLGGGALWPGADRAPEARRGDALAPLPLAALRIDAETVAALAQAGLKRIADVIDRPRAPLAARYGQNFVRRIDQALGREDEPITPRLPVPAAMAEQRFPDPIGREEDVLGTIEHLARELDRVLERRGEGARLSAGRAVPRRRQGASARARHRGAACAIRRACGGLFADRLAVLGDDAIPASASTCCGSRRW